MVDPVSCDQTTYEIDQSAAEFIDDLAIFFKWANFSTLLLRRDEPNCTIFGKNEVPSSMHQIGNFGTDALLRFQTTAAQRRVVSK